MAEPSTLTQMAINMANTDFIRRVTPHPQVASPLQQLITEDQQAKGDPGDNEIEGLDAEVLLNTDTLEDGEAVMLDFEGQGEMPSSHPPPITQLAHTTHPTAITTSLSTTVNKRYRPSPTIGASATDNQPEHGRTPPQPSNNQPIPHPSPRHVQWLQPRGPASILTAVPNYLQLVPATVLNGCHQSLFRHQLFEEDGVRMVRARCIGR